jgi:hypothetical protein
VVYLGAGFLADRSVAAPSSDVVYLWFNQANNSAYVWLSDRLTQTQGRHEVVSVFGAPKFEPNSVRQSVFEEAPTRM